MTAKPSRKDVKDNYSMIPYFAVYMATWGATILSRSPPWFYRPIMRAVAYTFNSVKEIMS